MAKRKPERSPETKKRGVPWKNLHPTASAEARGRTINPEAYIVARQKIEQEIKTLKRRVSEQRHTSKEWWRLISLVGREEANNALKGHIAAREDN